MDRKFGAGAESKYLIEKCIFLIRHINFWSSELFVTEERLLAARFLLLSSKLTIGVEQRFDMSTVSLGQNPKVVQHR